MQRDDEVYLGHMLDTTRRAVDRIAGKSRANFDDDEDLRIVLAHWVQTIREAASRVSSKTVDAHPKSLGDES